MFKINIITAAILLTGLFSSYATSTLLYAKTAPETPTSVDPTAAPTPTPATEELSPEESSLREDWRKSMLQIPLPNKGCFQSSYPSKEWQEAPCAPAPSYPQRPHHGSLPDVVGNGNNVVAVAPSGFISTTTGSFDSVSGVTSESGLINNTGSPVANAYTLQLNTNFFPSKSCTGTLNPAACRGWEQFIFENRGSAVSQVYIQYWLLYYDTTCPAGWTTSKSNTSTDCYKNSVSIRVPTQPITNLGKLSLTGTVSASGDRVSFSTGSYIYSVVGDNAVNAAAGWEMAEFNVFGDGSDSRANFNSGSKIVPKTRITDGSTARPVCVTQGFTGETNNLGFGPTAPTASQPGPALLFTESSAGASLANCDVAPSVD
jgi:hypothetical protein